MGVRRKRVAVHGSNLGPLITALAQAKGLEVVTLEAHGDKIDLVVVEASAPGELQAIERPNGAASAPVLVVAPRRLRPGEAQALEDAGAACVVDADTCLLDVACALSDLLFDTIAERRRYGLPVEFRPLAEVNGDHALASGRLVGLAGIGGFIHTTDHAPEGTPIELRVDLGGKSAPIRGRVAFVTESGFAIEFAHEDCEVAPRLSALGAAGAKS